MKRPHCLTILIFVFMITSCSHLEKMENPDPEERIRRVENGLLLSESIKDRMERHQVPGVSIAVINDFEIEWAKGYGVMKLGEDEPVTPDTLFQAASISKPVTALGAMQLVEQRRLTLDENVNDRLVSWQVPENEFTAQADVTLRRLLSHTAGVNQGLNRGYAPGEPIPTMVQALNGEPPANSLPVQVVRVPGAENSYSNGGYLIVAQLIQDAAGKPFSEVMQEAVFDPIGMTSSTFEQQLSPELEARAATPHGWDVAAWQLSPGFVGKPHVNDPGYSGLWTTAPDLARFGVEVMRSVSNDSGSVLSQAAARTMLVPVARRIPLQEPFNTDQALGFSLIDLGQQTWFIHFGGSFPGYISVLLAQPERGFGVAILTNAWTGYELIWEILYSIFYAYGFLPSTNQVLGMAYSLLLFLAAFLAWPLSYFIQNVHTHRDERESLVHKQSSAAVIATLVLLLTIAAILVLSLLYQGPLGGYLIPDRGRGESPLTKALLGTFFSSPIFLVVITLLVWRKPFWSIRVRLQYTLLALAALVGIALLGDLWGLMFWG